MIHRSFHEGSGMIPVHILSNVFGEFKVRKWKPTSIDAKTLAA